MQGLIISFIIFNHQMMKILCTALLFPLALARLIGIFLVTFIVAIAGTIWLKLFGFSRLLQYRVLTTWGKAVMIILGLRIDRSNLPELKNFILMPNHRSYLDIFIVARFTPAAFVGKAELKKWPFLKTAGRLTNIIFVSRSDIRSLKHTMLEIKKTINNQIPVIVFPEGTTYRGPLTKSFKSGSFKIAAENQIPVVPMAIHFKDENDAWVDDDTFIGHFFRQMCKPVTRVRIRYGDPVIEQDYKLLQEQIRREIDAMLLELKY